MYKVLYEKVLYIVTAQENRAQCGTGQKQIFFALMFFGNQARSSPSLIAIDPTVADVCDLTVPSTGFLNTFFRS